MAKEQQTIFVSVKNPVEIQRELLVSSKRIIETVKEMKNYHKVQEQKAQKFEELSKTLRKISTLSKKLKGTLPTLPGVKIEVEHEHVKEQKEHKKNLDFLEEEINRIEKKLRELV